MLEASQQNFRARSYFMQQERNIASFSRLRAKKEDENHQSNRSIAFMNHDTTLEFLHFSSIGEQLIYLSINSSNDHRLSALISNLYWRKKRALYHQVKSSGDFKF